MVWDDIDCDAQLMNADNPRHDGYIHRHRDLMETYQQKIYVNTGTREPQRAKTKIHLDLSIKPQTTVK
jgi:hypothetical protein